MKKFFILMIAIMVCGMSYAQQAIFQGRGVTSPEINADKTVTFRVRAPKAITVQVSGDCIEGRTANMTEKDGVWEYTTPAPVAPEMYTYNFIIDGQRTLDMNNVAVNRDVASLTNILLVTEPGARSDLYAVHDVPHGTVSRIWYHSDYEGINRRMTVYTPAGYETSGKRYPVFYLLHGIGGDEEAWITQGRTAQVLDNLIAQGKAQPMIVVMTNGNIAMEAAPLETSTGYNVPSMGLPKTMEGSFETAFPEIVKFIDKTYRTIPQKRSRAIAGLSMGGFHSKFISQNNPDMFNYIGLFSAAIGVTDANISPIYQDNDKKLATLFSKKPALYWIGIGNEDFLFNNNTDYRKFLDEHHYPYTYMETGGGHIWRNWRIYLTEFVPLLFK
ncbi:MAG: esterase [Bacteroidaceae bacterium]|nr:esterase [Bacteroidaceae bacterium]MBR3717180.1 esterase [Bacteroidaceae bacterium]